MTSTVTASVLARTTVSAPAASAATVSALATATASVAAPSSLLGLYPSTFLFPATTLYAEAV